MAALKVKDLCKTYEVNKRQINVLKNVSFNNTSLLCFRNGQSNSG